MYEANKTMMTNFLKSVLAAAILNLVCNTPINSIKDYSFIYVVNILNLTFFERWHKMSRAASEQICILR